MLCELVAVVVIYVYPCCGAHVMPKLPFHGQEALVFF